MNTPIWTAMRAVDARPAPISAAAIPGQGGLEFRIEAWQALLDAGLCPKEAPPGSAYDILVCEDPRIRIFCKAVAGPHGWFDAIGRAFYCVHHEPDARTILVVPYAGAIFEEIAHFCEVNDLHIATPDTIANTISALTKTPAKGPPSDPATASEPPPRRIQ